MQGWKMRGMENTAQTAAVKMQKKVHIESHSNVHAAEYIACFLSTKHDTS